MVVSRASWDYADSFVAEDVVLRAARAKGQELGCQPVSPGTGTALHFLAATLNAGHVVEVGTGAGVSGLWLLRGMRPDGVLTSVDVDPEHQREARATFEAAGFASSRYRLIAGAAMDVLPRLSDGAYDLVLVDGLKGEYPDYLEAGVRLLRPGGVICFDNALWQGFVADPDVTDADTESVRAVADLVREDERLVPVMLPVGDGLLAAVLRS